MVSARGFKAYLIASILFVMSLFVFLKFSCMLWARLFLIPDKIPRNRFLMSVQSTKTIFIMIKNGKESSIYCSRSANIWSLALYSLISLLDLHHSVTSSCFDRRYEYLA